MNADIQSETQLETQSRQPILVSQPPSTASNIYKILLFILLGLIIISGAILIGIQIGKSQIDNNQTYRTTAITTIDNNPVKPTVVPTTVTETNPLSNWKTYTNPNLGIELKYSPDFTFTTSSVPNNGMQITFTSNLRDILIIKRPNINPLTNKKYTSLEEFDPRVKNFSSVTIGNNQAMDSGTYSTQGATIQQDVVMLHEDSIWVFQDIQKENHASEPFDNMLATIKFIN